VEIIRTDGETRRIELPDSTSLGGITRDGQLVYWRRGNTIGAVDATGRSRTISHNYVRAAGEPGPSLGATWKDLAITSREELSYVERAGDRIEFRAWSPMTGLSRLVRSVMAARSAVSEHTVRGDLLVYAMEEGGQLDSGGSGDSLSIYIAKGSGEPRRVLRVRGNHSDGLSLSQDGKRLVFGVQVISNGDTSHAIGFVDIASDGIPQGSPRMTPAEHIAGVIWVPNSDDIVYHHNNVGGLQNALMRMSSQPGAQPRIISRQERSPFWNFVISPDGRTIAYPAELPVRSAIWRVELRSLSRAGAR
jgi:hypothetical protein